jgi:L-seryl-tRNA(Ser) seleniumtransferase
VTDSRRSLPAVHTLLNDAALAPLLERAARPFVTAAVRETVDRVRAGTLAPPASSQDWATLVAAEVARAEQPSLRRVINATGVVLHTNLGRAPLAQAAVDAIAAVAAGYANLEYDLEQGTRGSRLTHARALLRELTGAEDALVVNNCAAALVLALRALAPGRDVVVSRGELVEIGGSFRIPDIMAQAGVQLVEVGTTNRTHLDDYKGALARSPGAIVKVHRSNFTMDGFVAEVAARDLVALAAGERIPLVHDFGSGLMLDLSPWGLSGEPTAADIVATGANVVLLSGDKLLGGPQAGIALGGSDEIAAMRAHPLARALRVDKLTLAALEATLALYRDPARAVREIPALEMITATAESARARAAVCSARLASFGVEHTVVATDGAVGGGAFPAVRLGSAAIRLAGDASRWERALRAATVPVIGRIADGAMLLDVRALRAGEEQELASAVRGCAA